MLFFCWNDKLYIGKLDYVTHVNYKNVIRKIDIRIYNLEETFIAGETTTSIQIKFSLPLQDELCLQAWWLVYK